ncbi:hypothetical protein [Roseovarius mucosus]|uniref:hypothetical protein n=1 Tax=Roseovarius mucosus TaxID=215743 RepID=UPI003BABFED3
MAEALETIDGIARRLGRDVYYLVLVDEAGGFRDIYTDVSEITDWLDSMQIGWSLCAGLDEDTVWIESGPGCIVLDIHPDLGPEAMEMVEAHFMNAEGGRPFQAICPPCCGSWKRSSLLTRRTGKISKLGFGGPVQMHLKTA